MEITVYAGFLFLGLTVGSFLNALVFRLGTTESILWGRSHCMTCKHTLKWRELIPVVSFVMLGGKCRSCHDPVSIQYPIVELLTAAVFLLIYTNHKSDIFWYAGDLFFYFFAATLLLAIAIYDFRTKIIASALIIPFFILTLIGLAVRWFSGAALAEIAATVITAFLVFVFFSGLWFFSKGRAMGFGDAELAPAIVLFLGPTLGVVALLFSFWAGALFGITLIALGKASLKSDIPFGPFLVAGAFVAMFWGEALFRVWFTIFL